MAYLFTRQQLYERVWAEPISVLAKTLQVSDVGLAKACRRGAIPLPPRGYWAKRSAGQHVSPPPLPPRAPGASDCIRVGSGPRHVCPNAGTQGSGPGGTGTSYVNSPPEPPDYDETLDQVKARIAAAFPKRFRFDPTLDHPYPMIGRLLQEDEALREQQAKSGFPWDSSRFASRFERRRLCFLSNLFTVLCQFDVQPMIRGRDARETHVRVGNSRIAMSVDAAVKLRPRGRAAAKNADREPMAIQIEIARWQHGEAEEHLFWCDDATGKLERKLRDIAIAIVWAGERQLRKGRQFFYEMDCQTYQLALEEKIQRGEVAAQLERDRLAQAEADRVARLLGQIHSYQQAEEIREYVQQVNVTPTAVAGRAFDGGREAWTAWALALADQLDPLRPGDDL